MRRAIRCGAWVALGTTALSLTWASTADAQRAARRAEEPSTLLRPASPRFAGELEVVEGSAAGAAQRRHAVTDMGLRVKARPDMPLSVALSLDNSDPRAKSRSIFQLELMIVAGGRLLVEERAECRAWVGDVSLCRTECDGGQVALTRVRRAGAVRLTLMVGTLPDGERDGLGQGVRIGACAERSEVEYELAPRRGLRHVAVEFADP